MKARRERRQRRKAERDEERKVADGDKDKEI